MIPRSRRLQVVLTLETRREQQALERMNETRERLQAEQQRHEELLRYQQEYHQQMRSQQQGPVFANQLQGWQSFITRLDSLIRGQTERISRAEQVFEQTRLAWQQAWERRRGMEKYIATCRDQEQNARESAEQKQADEAAARQFSRRRH